MSFSRIYAIFIRQMFLIQSNPTRLASIFMWILVDVIQWGFISKYLGELGAANFGFITVILGAIILWEFMTRIQQGIMMGFLEDIWSQNFINYFASPLKVREYLCGLVVTSLATGAAGFAAMIAIAGLAFGYNFFQTGAILFPFLMVLLVFGISMGVLMSAIIFHLGPSAEWLGWPIPLVLSLFSGVFYPLSTLPAPMRAIAKLVPPSYIFESMRGLLSGGMGMRALGLNLLLSAALAAFYFVVFYQIFVRVYKKNLSTGAIARFNAETL